MKSWEDIGYVFFWVVCFWYLCYCCIFFGIFCDGNIELIFLIFYRCYIFGVIFNECLMFNKIMNLVYFLFNFEGICNDIVCI